MFAIAKKLTQAGVLGLNRRNAEYTLWHNPRHLYPLVDNKLTSKDSRSNKQAWPCRPFMESLKFNIKFESWPRILRPYQEFVIKPAQGSGGDGIIVITGRRNDRYRKANGQLMTQEDLDHHVSNALSGLYSLGGHPDKVLIEYRGEI